MMIATVRCFFYSNIHLQPFFNFAELLSFGIGTPTHMETSSQHSIRLLRTCSSMSKYPLRLCLYLHDNVSLSYLHYQIRSTKGICHRMVLFCSDVSDYRNAVGCVLLSGFRIHLRHRVLEAGKADSGAMEI